MLIKFVDVFIKIAVRTQKLIINNNLNQTNFETNYTEIIFIKNEWVIMY